MCLAVPFRIRFSKLRNVRLEAELVNTYFPPEILDHIPNMCAGIDAVEAVAAPAR